MKKTRVFWGIAILIVTSSCFHGRSSSGVVGYRGQTVFLKKDLSYKVGVLPKEWRVLKTPVKAAAFHNDGSHATISTDAFCGASFEDLPLKTLTGHLFAGTSKHNVIKEDEFSLDGRGALRTISTGTVDGIALKFDSVVVKKNNCTFDFIYISPPENYDGGVADFENFYIGFSF
ncbi:MAG: hypothetical protein A3I09_01930 [Deltaproteobacteria bacterium RIFCSPLOWO2_02_FULL_47_10]|nr:MAG: hypothetical protein A3I09_01930 [Deltaproteobacteria bacterium RIFCSPLOWO2_02_FULL_47_10]